jgi:hypothetical protein
MGSWKQVMQRISRAFLRPRVTVLIIAVLLVLFLAGLIIPQKELFTSPAQFDEWNAAHPVLSGVINVLKLNEIYVAPITIVFLALFFLNLVAVLVQRIPYTLRRAYLIDRETATAGIEKGRAAAAAHTIIMDGVSRESVVAVVERVVSFFRKRFWSVMTSGDGRSVLAVRNRYSPLGFLLFHVSFLLCLAGGLLVMYTRFAGTLLLTEGESFHADITQFKIIDTPKMFPALPDLGITLLGVAPRYESGTSTDLNVTMRIQYFKESDVAIARINEPVRRGALSILPQMVGISPLCLLKQPGSDMAAGGYFALNVLKDREDSFQFPDHAATVFVKFFPDYADEGGIPTSRSQEINNPVFHVRVQAENKILSEGFLKPGERLLFDGRELSFGDIRYWVEFLVVREYGTLPLAAGFLVGAAGLIMRLVFHQKTVRVHVEERGSATLLFVSGTGEYYPQAFKDELARLVAELEGTLKEGGQGEMAS